MRIVLNGEERQMKHRPTITDLLNELGVNNRYCAVERNAQLVPREQHDDVILEEDDQIEVVTLVGGG